MGEKRSKAELASGGAVPRGMYAVSSFNRSAGPLPMEPQGCPDLSEAEIAIVVPVYMGREFLAELCSRLVSSLSTITDEFRIVLVDDASPDGSWELIEKLCADDERIGGVQLSRNFGQHTALTAGLDHARARWYVVMDCDLQDAPEDIPALFAEAAKGYDIVVAVRKKEGHGFIKRQTSHLFYSLFKVMAGFELDWSVGNFRIFSERVADGFRQMRERMRFFPASLNLMGFNVGRLQLPHHSRLTGKSSYTYGKLARLAMRTILAHSDKPLRISAVFGLAVAGLSVLAAIIVAFRAFFWETPVTGWASLMVAVFMVGGIQMYMIGVLGIYIGKTFDETKRRPLYFVRRTSNIHAPVEVAC